MHYRQEVHQTNNRAKNQGFKFLIKRPTHLVAVVCLLKKVTETIKIFSTEFYAVNRKVVGGDVLAALLAKCPAVGLDNPSQGSGAVVLQNITLLVSSW